jgi:hypothetical protein
VKINHHRVFEAMHGRHRRTWDTGPLLCCPFSHGRAHL